MGEARRKSLVMQGTVASNEVEPNRERYPWETTATSPYDDRPLVGVPKLPGKGKLLREDLRRLPSEYVTDEIHEADAVHELDPEHIRDEVALKRFEKETTGEKVDEEAEEEREAAKPRRVSGNQETVDLLILVTAKGRLQSAKMLRDMGDPAWRNYLRHGYLWFPEDTTAVLEWRDGNPPPDSVRPRHLRGLDLVVDPLRVNKRIVDLINSSSVRRERYAEAINQAITEAEIRVAMVLGPEALQ